MKENIQKELISWAQKIVSNQINLHNINTLKQEIRSLYEKITILEYLEKNDTHITQSPVISTQTKTNEIKGFAQIQKKSDEKLQQNIPSAKPSINDILQQKKHEPTLEEILSQVPKDPIFEQKNPQKEVSKTLNDIVAQKAITIGLNDRIAFISHLFEGNEEDFSEAISVLDKLSSSEEVLRFIQEKIKPIFNHWEGKEEYEERFVNIVIRKFN